MLDKHKANKKGISKPRHIAITLNGMKKWIENNKIDVGEGYQKSLEKIKEIIDLQIKNSIPVITFYVLSEPKKKLEDTSIFIIELTKFFDKIADSDIISNNRIKTAVLGKWYDMPGRLVESIKKMINNTKDYDGFFVNFCVNYSGQEEIVDACKLMARQIKADKLDADAITKDLIKDNIYSSYFLPPDLIIKNGKQIRSDILLWDSVNAVEFFTEKLWPEFSKQDFENALKEYQKN